MATGDVYDVTGYTEGVSMDNPTFGSLFAPKVEETGFQASVGTVTPQDTGLSQTGASAIGAGIQAAGTLAGGIAQASQTKRLQEQAFQQGQKDIDIERALFSEDKATAFRAQNFADMQQQFANYQQDAALRSTRMMRDFQDEIEKATERRDKAKRFGQTIAQNEGFRDALTQMLRSK